jgi:hypothetical protein
MHVDNRFPCEYCRKPCIKKFKKAFCSDMCRLGGYTDYSLGIDGCWIWKGKVGNDGYGQIMIKGVRKRVHRVIFEEIKGKIGNKNVIRHICHVPLCVNPDHLKEGTPRENIEDMLAAKRSLFGEKSHLSKLTNDKVIKIRDLYASGNCTQKGIADAFGITSGTVHWIVNRKTWKHIEQITKGSF